MCMNIHTQTFMDGDLHTSTPTITPPGQFHGRFHGLWTGRDKEEAVEVLGHHLPGREAREARDGSGAN